MTENVPFIYRKLIEMVNKRQSEGVYPRNRLEEKIARDFRLCRDDVRKIMSELNLGKKVDDDYNAVIEARRKKRNAITDYRHEPTDEELLRDLRFSRNKF